MYIAWVVPARINNAVKERLLKADQCLANVIGNVEEAKVWLVELLKTLILTGSLNNHILQTSCNEEGLPAGAIKLLLDIS